MPRSKSGQVPASDTNSSTPKTTPEKTESGIERSTAESLSLICQLPVKAGPPARPYPQEATPILLFQSVQALMSVTEQSPSSPSQHIPF